MEQPIEDFKQDNIVQQPYSPQVLTEPVVQLGRELKNPVLVIANENDEFLVAGENGDMKYVDNRLRKLWVKLLIHIIVGIYCIVIFVFMFAAFAMMIYFIVRGTYIALIAPCIMFPAFSAIAVLVVILQIYLFRESEYTFDDMNRILIREVRFNFYCWKMNLKRERYDYTSIKDFVVELGSVTKQGGQLAHVKMITVDDRKVMVSRGRSMERQKLLATAFKNALSERLGVRIIEIQ